MAKAGKSWRKNGTTYRYYYPNAPSKKGRYLQMKTHKGWSRWEFRI